LGAGGADAVFTELLSRHALEIINDRKRRGQPLDDIPVARISAQRKGAATAVAVLDLEQPDDVIEIDLPDSVQQRQVAGYDLLGEYGERKGKDTLALGSLRADELKPLSEELHLTSRIEASLRMQGVDPDHMSVRELGLGLLRLTGYDVSDHGTGSFIATGHGSTTYVSFVSHSVGEHPELPESAITRFLVAQASARTERGLLMTDKYGPYLIYQKERANPDLLFVTRERLQDFVDTIAVS